jgi:hypothetical protein
MLASCQNIENNPMQSSVRMEVTDLGRYQQQQAAADWHDGQNSKTVSMQIHGITRKLFLESRRGAALLPRCSADLAAQRAARWAPDRQGHHHCASKTRERADGVALPIR